jgi:iron(III) transport system permease protein
MALTSAPKRVAPIGRILSRLDPSMLLPLGIVVVIGYLTLVPVGMMVTDSFTQRDGSLGIDHYKTILTSGSAYRLMGTSVVFALGSSVVAAVIGSVLAWLVERTNLPARRLIFAAALVPLIMPGALSTFAWVLILSPRVGVINVALQKVFGFSSGPFDVYSMPGMILVEGIHLSTLAFLMMAGALRSVDASLEEAASTSGAGIVTAASPCPCCSRPSPRRC